MGYDEIYSHINLNELKNITLSSICNIFSTKGRKVNLMDLYIHH